MQEELDEQSWQVRETFAYFGRAAYMASVLEVGLAHVLMLSQYMMQEREKIIATKGKGFDRKAYEAGFDAFMDQQFAQTMGNLVRRVEKFDGFDEAIRQRISEAKKRRDFLMHHYWRERSIQFATPEGRESMRAELNDDAETFEKLDRDIEAASAIVRKKLGIDDAVVDKYIEEMMDRVKVGGQF
jgi:hypothetical protein